jgi:hypothetical protein
VFVLAYHLRALREAGLKGTCIEGRRRYQPLRREDLELRLPVVIDPIIKAATGRSGAHGWPAVPPKLPIMPNRGCNVSAW